MEFIILGFAVYYVTMTLLFDIDDLGPFPAKKAIVRQAVDGQLRDRPVDLFDRFRYLFGAYKSQPDSNGQRVWFIRPNWMMVWVCPYCLCFWVANVLGLLQAFVPESHMVLQLIGLAGFVRFLVAVRG